MRLLLWAFLVKNLYTVADTLFQETDLNDLDENAALLLGLLEAGAVHDSRFGDLSHVDHSHYVVEHAVQVHASLRARLDVGHLPVVRQTLRIVVADSSSVVHVGLIADQYERHRFVAWMGVKNGKKLANEIIRYDLEMRHQQLPGNYRSNVRKEEAYL